MKRGDAFRYRLTPAPFGLFLIAHYEMDFRNRSSTFFLAQGVRRKKDKLDLMLGLWVKHLMGMRFPNSAQPYFSTS
jgi:hypothetical protein